MGEKALTNEGRAESFGIEAPWRVSEKKGSGDDGFPANAVQILVSPRSSLKTPLSQEVPRMSA
jgi:hypothetical protein